MPKQDLDAIPWSERDWSPAQFCVFKNISPWLFDKYKRERLIKVTVYSAKLHRITPAARAAFDAAMEAAAESKASKLERARRRQHMRVAAQNSVRSRQLKHSTKGAA